MRILLFLATNLAVIVLVSVVFNLLGFEGILADNGVDLDLTALLVFCALFGFGGSLISLLMSKKIAKWSTRAQVISQPGCRCWIEPCCWFIQEEKFWAVEQSACHGQLLLGLLIVARGQQLAEIDRFAVRVRHFNADGIAARYHGHANRDGAH